MSKNRIEQFSIRIVFDEKLNSKMRVSKAESLNKRTEEMSFAPKNEFHTLPREFYILEKEKGGGNMNSPTF